MISYESCSKDMVTFELNKEEIDENIFCVENTESIQTIQLQAGVNAAVILLKPKTGIILSLEQKIKLRTQLFIHTLSNTHNKYFYWFILAVQLNVNDPTLCQNIENAEVIFEHGEMNKTLMTTSGTTSISSCLPDSSIWIKKQGFCQEHLDNQFQTYSTNPQEITVDLQPLNGK